MKASDRRRIALLLYACCCVCTTDSFQLGWLGGIAHGPQLLQLQQAHQQQRHAAAASSPPVVRAIDSIRWTNL